MYLEESPYQRDQLINIDQLIGRALDHGVELGDDHHKTIENYVNFSLLPRLLNGQFSATAVDRLVFIDNMLKQGKSVEEIKSVLEEERKKFLKKPMNLSSLVNAYKSASKSLLMLGSVGFAIFLLSSLFVSLPDSSIKKGVGQPFGRVLAAFIKEAKPTNSNSSDPLGLTNVGKIITINEKHEVTILKTITTDSSTSVAPVNNSLIDTNNLAVNSIDVKNILSSKIVFPNLSGATGVCVLALDTAQVLNCSQDQFWTAAAIKAIADSSASSGLSELNLTGTGISVARTGNAFALSLANDSLSSIDGVKNNTGDIDFIAGAGVTITPNDSNNTITFNLVGSGVNADLLDSIDSSQFLRSDTSDNFTSGTLTLDAGTTLNILGTVSCTNCIADTAIPDTITVSNYLPLAGGTLAGGVTANGTFTFNTDVDLILSGTENVNLTSDLATTGSLDLLSITLTPSTSNGATRAIYIHQLDSANVNGLDTAIRIENSDTTLSLQIAIELTAASLNGITTGIDATNVNTVINANYIANGIILSNANTIGVGLQIGGVAGQNVTTGVTVGAGGFGGVYTTGYNYQLTGIQTPTYSSSGTNAYLADIVCISCTTQTATLTNAFHVRSFGANSTITNGINIEAASSGVITSAININGAGVVIDLVLQNGETIDNDTDGRINLNGDVMIDASITTYTQRLCHSGADGATTNLLLGDCNAAGQADFAEYYGTDGSLESGDVVAINQGNKEIDSKAGLTSKAFVKKTSLPYQKDVIGIISTNPYSEILGEGVFSDSDKPKPVALTGRVPVKVSSENGSIEVGDYLTSSYTPGVSMKATSTGPTIGKALESYSGAGVSKILVFVDNSFYVNFNESQTYTLNSETNYLTNFISKTGNAIFSKVTTAIANVGKLVFGEIAVKRDSQSAGFGEVSASADEITIFSNKVRIDSLINLTSTSEPDGVLYIKAKKDGESFVVGVKRFPGTESNQKIKFNWLIINQE